jgi:hypothetical protein
VSGWPALVLDTLHAVVDAPHDTWHGPRPYEPTVDALLRRLAERLPADLIDDVVQLVLIAKGRP